MIHARKDYDSIQDARLRQDGGIPQDEPVMFRAQDCLAPSVLSHYAWLLKNAKVDQHMIDAVLLQERKMREWQRIHRVKLPDMPEEAVPEEVKE
jgi:hypothetical protein